MRRDKSTNGGREGTGETSQVYLRSTQSGPARKICAAPCASKPERRGIVISVYCCCVGLVGGRGRGTAAAQYETSKVRHCIACIYARPKKIHKTSLSFCTGWPPRPDRLSTTTTTRDEKNEKRRVTTLVANLVEVEGHGHQGGHEGHRVPQPFRHAIPQLKPHLLGEAEVPRHLLVPTTARTEMTCIVPHTATRGFSTRAHGYATEPRQEYKNTHKHTHTRRNAHKKRHSTIDRIQTDPLPSCPPCRAAFWSQNRRGFRGQSLRRRTTEKIKLTCTTFAKNVSLSRN